MTVPNRDQATTAFNDPVSQTESGVGKSGEENYSFLEPPVEPGDLGQLAQYRILKLLGAGGMGYVFAAEDTHLARKVALKVMRPEFASDPAFRERFLVEARAAAGLTSDYIVTVYQVGTAGDVPFQAIQLLTGESLQERIQRAAPMPVALSCLILRHAAEGLAVAHEKHLIHRDIKPANIWLESNRPGGSFRRARLLDFGLARSDNRDTKLTATGVIVGTPHFMSPEQASGYPLDGRSDVFSLGCVAYSMLTGQMAFEGTTTMAVLMALASHTPPSLTEKNPAVPQELSYLVAAMMAKEPAGRPASAVEVCDALDAILTTLPDPLADMDPDSGVSSRPSGLFRGPGSTSVGNPRTAPSSLSRYAPKSGASSAASPPSANRRWWPFAVAGVALVASALGLFALLKNNNAPDPQTPPAVLPVTPPVAAASAEPIPVGVLHSLSGTMALSESPVVDAVLLAIDEVNAAGGVLGRQLVPVVADGASDPEVFQKEAERLLKQEKVGVIFGCWTSASRKAVRPIIERHNSLMFYPVQYEGLEQSPHIVYLGSTPNQQLIPALEYLIKREGKKRLFVVGSDYVYPRAAYEIIKDTIKANKGTDVKIVGDAFMPLGSKDVAKMVEAIAAAKPDAIVNMINGTTNFDFFRELNANPATENLPVMSLSIMERDLRVLDAKSLAGDFLAGTYFESVGTPLGNAFMEKIRRRYGQERRYSDPTAAAYSGVHLWARAANAAGKLDLDSVTKALPGVSFEGPVGEIKIEPLNQHLWLPARIGRIRADGSVESVDESIRPLRPEPFPPTRTRDQWDRYLSNLFLDWDGKWQAPVR